MIEVDQYNALSSLIYILKKLRVKTPYLSEIEVGGFCKRARVGRRPTLPHSKLVLVKSAIYNASSYILSSIKWSIVGIAMVVWEWVLRVGSRRGR